MPDAIDLQSEQFMTLLTDALRSGPGSPEWNQAVKALRASNGNIDEYTLLHTAREHLESAKDFRSVRAGPGFTRKVLEGIDRESEGAAGGLPTAGLIALIAAGAILVVVVVIGVMLLKGSNPKQQAIEELTGRIFGNKLLAASFPAPPANPAKIPDGWTKFGEAPLMTKGNELRAASLPATHPATADSNGYKAGGLVTSASIPSDQPLEVDVTARVTKAADDSIVEVFVSDEAIADDNAAAGHALVWQFKGGEARVFLADGSAAPHAEKVGGGHDLAIKLLLNRDIAVVDTGGQRLFAGAHLLAPDKPRYVGIRFRRKAGDKAEQVGVVSVTLQKP
jgi:hypothetical protein